MTGFITITLITWFLVALFTLNPDYKRWPKWFGNFLRNLQKGMQP